MFEKDKEKIKEKDNGKIKSVIQSSCCKISRQQKVELLNFYFASVFSVKGNEHQTESTDLTFGRGN